MSKFQKQTLEQEFLRFWERVYHDVPTDSVQFREVRQTFYAGALVTIVLTAEAANLLPEAEDQHYLHGIAQEAMEYALQRVEQLKAEDRISSAGNG